MCLPWAGRRVVPLCRECVNLGQGGGLFPCVGSVFTFRQGGGLIPCVGSVFLPWAGRRVAPLCRVNPLCQSHNLLPLSVRSVDSLSACAQHCGFPLASADY